MKQLESRETINKVLDVFDEFLKRRLDIKCDEDITDEERQQLWTENDNKLLMGLYDRIGF